MAVLCARFVFPHYWEVFAIVAALGEWSLWCWLMGPPPGAATHAAGLVGLFAVSRLAAVAYEREDARAPIRHRLGGTVLAAGLVSAGGVGGLVVAALAWLLLVRAGGLSAEAGVFPLGREVAGTWGLDLAGTIGLLGGMGLVLHGYLRGYRRLRVVRLEVTVPHLPRALDGLRIVHLSDLHLGPLTHRPALAAVVEHTRAERPDLVVVTGDIADSPMSDLADWLPELGGVEAPLGVYAILGNHDRFCGRERVTAAIRQHTRWHLLRDEIAYVDARGSRLAIVGLEDRAVPHESDALPALAAQLPAETPAVLLAHHPNVFPVAARLGLPVTLAGHTHGGQVAVPGVPGLNAARLLMTPFDRGTFVVDGAVLHVSCGIGTSGQRVRIAVASEIAVVTLRAPAAG